MKLSCLTFAYLLLIFSSQKVFAQPDAAKPKNPAAIQQTSFPKSDPAATYTYRVIKVEGGTHGYEILQNGRPMINQTTIPGRPGNKGFTTQADAGKVAELVITKLQKGEMPPSITPEEIKKLNIN